MTPTRMTLTVSAVAVAAAFAFAPPADACPGPHMTMHPAPAAPAVRLVASASLRSAVRAAQPATTPTRPAAKRPKVRIASLPALDAYVITSRAPVRLCFHNGRVHRAGEAVPSGDRCNRCVCASDGTVRCTLAYCPAR